MPSPLPSSFASAAAGNNQDSRKDNSVGGGEWTRSRMNGATQTFRRPSVATNLSHTRDSSQPMSASTPTSAAYIPPHLSSSQPRNGSTVDSRYSKEQLLNIFKTQRDSGALGKNMGDHFLAAWNPLEDSSSTNGAWGKREDQKDPSSGPEVCWDHLGQHGPLGLTDLTDDERELFTTTVNSPLKPPPSSASKENAGPVTGRKSSISHANTFNTSSPNSARPPARRRETQDSTGNPMSPTSGTRYFREEPNTTTPPPSLLRRKTDIRDSSSTTRPEEKDKATGREGSDVSSPFGSLKRSTTNPVVSGLATTSPWPSGSQTSNISPMGAFGSFSLGPSNAQPSSATEKRPGYGSLRGESRFKGLLSKDSSEDVGKDKGLQRGLDRLTEDEGGSRSQSPWGEPVKTRAVRSETNPFDEPRSGSASLGGSQEVASGVDELGFSAFGMTAGVPGIRELIGRGEDPQSPFHGLSGLEPTSPTNTNPYQSPRGEKAEEDVDTDGSDVQRTQHPGLSGLRDEPSAAFGSIRRAGSGLDASVGDRSQTSSAGPSRSFSGLGGLGAVPGLGGASGWPSAGAIGTPTRERSAFTGFGDPIFGSVAEMQSPSLSSLGGGGFFGSHAGLSNTGSIGRTSKMGALFPSTMQEQMQGDQARPDDGSRQQETNPSSQVPITSSTSALHTPLAASGEVPQTSQTPSAGSSGTIPTAQQRTMVMPDRMRWIYRDPQGNIQGPWSGLEMHDWFKAGFFTAELQVKKLEDPEFEPLAQLVRRIGNSREPFLVPQIGIPHGPDPTSASWTAPSQTGTAQPPFANSFPTFGTTLTAEQQNALERRKQEEQYLMARQKEHLAQQQALMKQIQLQGGPHNIQPPLQHQSSAHSLQSQPSFGSINSPAAGYQPSPIHGPIQPPQTMPGYFDAPFRQNSLSLGPQILGTDFGSHDELPGLLDRLNINRGGPFPLNSQASFGTRQQEAGVNPQQINSMLQDRARLQQEQEQFDKSHPDSLFEQQAREERLRQFHALRSDEEELALRGGEGLPTHPTAAIAQQVEQAQLAGEEGEFLQNDNESEVSPGEPLSLSQQVQKAATAQRQQKQAQTEAAWTAKGDPGIPHPFPPPPSASPLPAPAAQRNRQNVADALAATSRSQSQTPIETPSTSIAPWAKDTIEAPKGPSLKEIQEAEARNAAQREELAAQARRAQLIAEQERLSQAQQAAAPGLPSTANWASGASPTPPTAASSVWSKPVTKATTAPAKTLAQIQKEEEARKQRLAQTTTVQTTAASPTGATAAAAAAAAAGKRYADLASKAAAPVPPTTTGAWTTVGAGGKAKSSPVAPVAPAGPRSTSATITTPQAVKAKPVAPVRTVTVGTMPTANPNRATEEFTKWAKITLGKGLNNGINVDDFVQQLLLLPAEAEIISDSVYANSQTLDGRRFADEFIRRRKLAEKGIVDPISADTKASSGGWSEVAKKSSSQPKPEEDATAAFKVVAGKKKGKR
ncbi:PERQ amino acid-rich with GYF domain-containing protein 2 [Talaromyces islandicus]|uniref:PERQ amino acid-rich with GYF domain-containing protein 2 n=1 Tax=Talaromyces islandicus TaxID=28573 RepID=A0A0U1LLQ4_TALIS|nr:PERQ amino acid-rich with GYF domain-containing protein 2 [Talaromyces islandicus]